MTIDFYAEKRNHKKVILCNADQYTHVTDSDVAGALMGMGLCEWEYYMGRLFTGAVASARAQHNKNADITEMFGCQLVGVDLHTGPYHKTQESVIAFLMEKLFDKVSENENELNVKVREGIF